MSCSCRREGAICSSSHGWWSQRRTNRRCLVLGGGVHRAIRLRVCGRLRLRWHSIPSTYVRVGGRCRRRSSVTQSHDLLVRAVERLRKRIEARVAYLGHSFVHLPKMPVDEAEVVVQPYDQLIVVVSKLLADAVEDDGWRQLSRSRRGQRWTGRGCGRRIRRRRRQVSGLCCTRLRRSR